MAQRTSVQYVRFYTEGTAARKLEYAVPQKKVKTVQPKPRKVKPKKIYVDPVAILGVTVAICMFIVMAVGINQLKQVHAESVRMEQYVNRLAFENKELTEEYADSYDIEMVKQTAEALGMVPRDEVPVTTIQITVPVEEVEDPTAWETIGTLLTNLFA